MDIKYPGGVNPTLYTIYIILLQAVGRDTYYCLNANFLSSLCIQYINIKKLLKWIFVSNYHLLIIANR